MQPTDTNDSETEDDTVEDGVSSDLDDVLEDARAFLTLCKEAENENRLQAKDDLVFLAVPGGQWDPLDAAQRGIDRRPMLTVNKLPAFLHQVTNSLRQNRPGIKIHPVSAGADVDTAKVRQGMIRHMEYSSNADVAYDTAACSAAAIGFGYFRLITDYCYPDSFDQDIKFSRIRNPFTVYFDPLSTDPAGADQRKCLIVSKMTRQDFKRLYPKASANDTALAIGDTDLGTNWMFTDEVVIAEFYRIEEVPAELWLLSNGAKIWADEVPEADKAEIEAMIVKKRSSFKRKVMLYKITGTDKLEETEIKCYWIPVFRVIGDEVDVDGKVYRSGLVRNAKDPCRMYNYWMTSATEEVALRQKTPYIMAAGQEEGFEVDWATANTRSKPYLKYNPITVDGNLAPAPQRQPMADIPSGMLQMAMHANDNIKATTGLFDSSLGARGNATSGKQELAQQRQGDISNFHFADSLNMAVRQAGRCIDWMIPYYYDTERVVQIMQPDDTVSHETINQQIPVEQQQADPLSGAIKSVLNDMTGGEYSVTVSAGPSYQTLRQEAAESMLDMTHNNPQLMAIAGDLIVAEMDWPGADKIANRIKKSLPPNLTAGEEGATGQSAEMKLAQAQQAMQAVQAQSQQLEQHAQAIMEREQQLKEEALKVQGEKMEVNSAYTQLQAEAQILKADHARLSTELKLQISKAEGAVAGTRVEESIEWKKALLDAQTKITVAEIDAGTKVKTAAMSANSSNPDSPTTVSDSGETQLSPAFAALSQLIAANNADLMRTFTEVAARPRKTSARATKQGDGSFLMEKIEE